MKYNVQQHKANQDIANTINKLNAANGIDSRISARDVAAVAAAYGVTPTTTTSETQTKKESAEATKKTYSLQPIGAKILSNLEKKSDKSKEKTSGDTDKWYQGYFQKGDALEEGITPGNVAKAYLGSLADIATNLPAGVVGWGENVVDFGATLLGGAADVLGAHDFRDKMTDFVKKDLYDEQAVTKAALKKSANINPLMSVLSTIVKVEDLINKKGADNSVLDYKADSFVQSTGEVAAKIGISAAVPGVPIADIITGVTAFGQQSETALNEGATVGQAIGSSLVSAGAEVLFEKMSGFTYGGKSFTDGFKKRLAEKISKAGLRTFLSLAGDFASEGLEEVATEFVSKLGTALYKEENWRDIVSSDEALQDYIDSFIQGSLLGGTFSSVKTISHISAGNEALKDGSADSILEKAKQIAETESENETGYEAFKNIKFTYEQLSHSLEKTNGEISTINQKALLGQLKEENARAQLMPYIERSAENIVKNIDLVAQRYGSYGIKDANGKAIPITKESIMSGIDVNADRQTFIKQLRNALTNNPVLSTLAVIDATGHTTMDTAKFVQATLEGKNLANHSTLEYFVANGTDAEKATLGKALGIQNWDTVSLDEFKNKVSKIASTPTINPVENASFASESGNINAESANLNTESASSNVDNATITENVTDTEVVQATNYAAAKVNAGILSLVDKVKSKLHRQNEKIYLPNISPELSKKIFELTGIDTTGFRVAIEARQIDHILKDHGENGKTDQSMKDPSDIAKMEYALTAPDSIISSEKVQGYSYMKDGKNRTAPSVLYEKEIGSKSYYVVQAVPDTKAKTLYIVSAFIGKKGYKKGASQLIDTLSPDVTSKNGSVVTPNNNISQNSEKVKENSKKSFDNGKKALPGDENSRSDKGEATEAKSMTVIESATFAKENVPEYSELNADDQARVRRLIRQAKASGFTDAQTRAYARVAARSNIDIVIDKESLKLGDGRYADGVYSAKRNKIIVNPEGSRSPARLLIHELTHAIYNDGKGKLWLERGAQNLSKEEKNRIIDKYFSDVEIVDENGNIDEKIVLEYNDELNAHYTEALLDDDALLEKLCNDNPTLPDKILSFFKKAITGYSDEPNLSREAKKLYKRYKTLFDSFSERNQYADAKKQGEERYALREDAAQEVEKALNDKNYKGEVKLTDSSPLILTSQKGVKNLPLTMKASHIRENIFDEAEARKRGLKVDSHTHYHGLGKELYLKVIDELDSVTEAYRGTKNASKPERRENYFLLISKLTDKDGNVINVPVYVNEHSLHNRVFIDANKVSTVFGKTELRKYINQQIANGELVRVKIRNTQTSESTTLIDADYGMSASGNSISQNSEKSTENAKKVSTNSGDRMALPDTDSEGTALSPEQREYFADTKVVDAQGQLLVLYHQTVADFTEFDTMREGAGARDNETPHGIFLKPTPDDIGLKGDKQMRLYVNITNPLIFHDRASALLHWKQNIEGYKEIIEEISNNDRKYQDLFDEAFSERRMARKLKNMEFSDLDRAEKLRIVEESSKASEKVIDEWTEANTKLDKKAKALIDDYLKNSDYDGVIIDEDQGSFGRKVKTYIALHPEQVKNVDNTAPTNNPDIRYALPDTESDTVDTSDSVGKKRQQYKASIKERIFTAADSIYIDTVDELYGVTKYLTKVGKIKDAASAVQAVRASMSAAQVMLGDVQYDIFSDNGKKLGEGLSKIIKPITVKGEKITNSFNEYLLHWLNIDRMSLEERSLAELEGLKTTLREDIEKLREVNGKLAEAKAKKQSMFSDSEVQQSLDKTIKKLEKMQKEMRKSIKEQKKQIDNFVVMENKPVFGENEKRLNAITAEQSRKKIAEMEKVHPDFKAVAEKVWAYTKNLNHMRVEAGLISADSEAYMNELYPHYVPSNRDLSYSGVGAIKGKRNLEISSTVKRAKGGGEDVLDVFDSIALQTQELLRAGRINQLFRKIYDVAVESGDNTYVEVISKEKVSRADSASMQADSIEIRPKGNQITGFIDGEKVTLKVTDEIFIAFDNMSKPTVDPTSALGKGAQRLNELYKKLLTSYSPAFLIRNPIRDLQDAGLNSKHSILFAKNLKKAVETMLKNGEAWQIYRAYGGYSASIFGPEGFSANVDSRGFEAMAKLFDSDEVTIKTVYEAAKRSGKNLLTGINNLNAFVEQATRFAEYLASIEAGESIPVAINNAAEVTTNFGRRGRLTKKMNATIMPFLNPSIQGFDKIFRNVTDAFKEGTPTATAKALANLLGKAAVIGLAPMLVNMLLYGDDDDYEKLREADKENNFLIKVGDTFIKIPRGRLASVIGGTANRGSKLIKGEDADLKDYAENVINQVTPVGNLTRTIISPFFDLMNNRTWYGGEIEGRQFDNTAPKDRYDESTSSWAIAIGKVINYSPKKIHYLLDQYMGVIGDFVLPATSKKASKDFFSGNFTIDPATSNKLSTSFYKIYDKAQYAKTAGDDTAIYQVKYLNKVKDAISDMYDKKSEIQNNSELSNVEKLQQSRVVQILINQAYETALADIDRYTQAFKATEGIESTSLFKSAFGTEATEATVQKMRYTEATRYMYGAKKALEEYDDAVYAKCELLNLAGVDYDKLYNYYFATKGLTSDTDKQGNVISGSKKKKVVAAINALGVSREQKLLLIASKGYSLTDSEKKRLLSYILKLKTTKEKRIELAELCGFTVRNGKIVANFK